MSLIQDALKSIDFDIMSNTKNAHYEFNGVPVPRTTEILSTMIHKDSLMYWANSLGFKGLRYKEVLMDAANMGTIAHVAIERFLKEKLETENNIPFLGFMQWYNMISESLPIEPMMIEEKLSCEWFGGTLDALLKIGDKICLVDFKTSNHVTCNYFLQLSAYRYMLKRKYNIDIDMIIVLQLDKSEVGFKEFYLDLSIPEHMSFISQCEQTFLSLVYAYYNLKYTEGLYNKIF